MPAFGARKAAENVNGDDLKFVLRHGMTVRDPSPLLFVNFRRQTGFTRVHPVLNVSFEIALWMNLVKPVHDVNDSYRSTVTFCARDL
eukprot:27376-Hanusia_phi.AAC.1